MKRVPYNEIISAVDTDVLVSIYSAEYNPMRFQLFMG